ncbi:hypothetical protein, unlikely [Trypanosoma brucei gambiense DAL972]|uniref:Uncharacterized protein n=1 Tax=Trypanosoma brucei gambiense (strain MHOM/CI/86/DAL972) TaxID=679716 RepID=C9ZST0_TRYB9|nr:hypothetical protein, unlikely [Trypanosoma brucei gambiense DAL972]CBH12465.1 hypothetical protein, unlikely [Trypanosoma brucei gambiense DAL972]|eukprot:XP_011774745.1 hypothetical protein, unlikely [Trypanosoma brucei gambiense DAL972]
MRSKKLAVICGMAHRAIITTTVIFSFVYTRIVALSNAPLIYHCDVLIYIHCLLPSAIIILLLFYCAVYTIHTLNSLCLCTLRDERGRKKEGVNTKRKHHR